MIPVAENLQTDLVAALLDKDQAIFTRQVFHTTDPGTEYLHNWHVDCMTEYLRACELGQISRLIINVPPRYMKSTTVTVAWPAWLLKQNPSNRIIAASYSSRLSEKHSTDTRLVVQSPWYQTLWPHVQIVGDQNTKTKFQTTQRGHRIATSVGGSVTGEGGNFLIVDDPVNPSQAMSDADRVAANNWFDMTFSTRLDDKKRGVIVVVMQRLNEDDLTGHIKDKGYTHLCLQGVAEHKQIIDMGKFHKVIEEGDLLHPQREGPAEIAKAKQDLGSYGFAAQYQQTPVPVGGGMVKKAWIRRYATPPNEGMIYQSWDTAIKAGDHNDWTVCTTWRVSGNLFYLLDVYRERIEYHDIRKAVEGLAADYKPNSILIEDKGSGQNLLQDMRRYTSLPVVGINPDKDKITRMAACSPMIEAQRVLLPIDASWLPDYERELFLFPASAKDDQVDSTSQFLNHIRGGSSDFKDTMRTLGYA